MMKDDILHYFLNAAAQVEPTKQVTQAVVCKIVFIVLLEDTFPMDVISLHGRNDKRSAQIAQVGGSKYIGYFLAMRFHGVGNVPYRNEFADVVSDKCGEVFNERHVADFLPCDNIPKHNGVVNSLKIVPYLVFILHIIMAKARKSAHTKIGRKTLVCIFQFMETQEFLVCETVYGNLNIPSGKPSAQF